MVKGGGEKPDVVSRIFLKMILVGNLERSETHQEH